MSVNPSWTPGKLSGLDAGMGVGASVGVGTAVGVGVGVAVGATVGAGASVETGLRTGAAAGWLAIDVGSASLDAVGSAGELVSAPQAIASMVNIPISKLARSALKFLTLIPVGPPGHSQVSLIRLYARCPTSTTTTGSRWRLWPAFAPGGAASLVGAERPFVA